MTRLVLVLACLALSASGCGGGSRYAAGVFDARTRGASGRSEVEADSSSVYGEVVATQTVASSTRTGSAYDSAILASRSLDDSGGAGASHEAPQPSYAQAERTSVADEPGVPPEATDAVDTSGELLIYTALFHVAVFDVEAAQARLVESARSAGGFVFAQSDDRVVVRLPAPRFRSFLATVEGAGDVLHRQIDAQDVGEEFRDLEVRLRNLEAMRARIEQLLAGALTVEQALVVERELERVTAELESMRGRQRYLADHIAFSTVTVLFQPAPREAIDQPEVFQLPFPWLESLGLSTLLRLR